MDRIVDVLSLWDDDALEKHIKKKHEEYEDRDTEYADDALSEMSDLDEESDGHGEQQQGRADGANLAKKDHRHDAVTLEKGVMCRDCRAVATTLADMARKPCRKNSALARGDAAKWTAMGHHLYGIALVGDFRPHIMCKRCGRTGGRKTSSLKARCRPTTQTRKQLDRVFLEGVGPEGGAQVEAVYDIQNAIIGLPGR